MNKKLASIASGCVLLLSTLNATHCNSQPISPKTLPVASGATAKPADGATDVKPTTWKWESEQEWIIDSIGKDVAEMLLYAKYHNDPSAKFSATDVNFHTATVDKKTNKYKFELLLPGSKKLISNEFTINGYVWDPRTYQPFVKQMMDSLQLKADSKSTAPTDYLKRLSNADMNELFAENERISNALSTSPLDPSLHEQAALLQAAFDMLELAGNFSDTRAPLNRITAHLAIAESLNTSNDLTLPGKLADIALESMSCRDGVAVTRNDDLAKTQTDETVKSWLRALKIRSSGDYRIFDEAKQTPLEASQFGMRYANFLSADKAIEYISEHNCTPRLRWMRIALCGHGSVGSGHQVDSKIVPVEIEAFSDDYKLYNKQTLSETQLVDELNRTSTRCLTNDHGTTKLVTLSWDDVAAYHARHILYGVYAEHHFYAKKYGDPELADESIKNATEHLGGMTLFPISLMGMENDNQHKAINTKFFDGMQKLLTEHPEGVPAYPWIGAKYKKVDVPKPALTTRPELWFEPPYPMGTAYYFAHRQNLANCHPDMSELTRLRTLCPLDSAICWQWARKKFGENPTAAQLREACGKLIEFDLEVQRICVSYESEDPVNYEKDMLAIAKLSPNDYFTLAYHFARTDPEKASKYFEEGINKAEDPVMASNRSMWLVNYLYDKGDKEKAMAVAQRAAAVYSARGLNCLANLYDRMGNFEKAEKIHLQVSGRYGEQSNERTMLGFYIRNASKNKRYADNADKLLKKDFPNGLQRFELADLTSPPKTGAMIKESQYYADSLGLKVGYIVVGLNGYKTDTSNQYFAIQEATLNPKIKATFWDGTKYKEVVVTTIFDNKLGITIADYPKKKELKK